MAKKYPLHVCSVRAATLLALLASPLACTSDAEDDPSEDTSNGNALATSPTVIRERDDAPAAPSASDDTSRASAPAPSASAASRADDPGPADTADASGTASDSAPSGAGAAAEVDAITPAAAAAQTFAACSIAQGIYAGACNAIYVTMQQASPALCVQLTIDNCGSYNRQGLPVDTPVSWRLASAAIGDSATAPCELGTFYPDRASVADASGSISWDTASRRPSQLVLDLTLETGAASAELASIDVVTSAPIDPPPCAD